MTAGGKPMSKEESDKAVKLMQESMTQHGWWNKVCVHCGGSCGGMLAEYGKPSPKQLRYVACPHCYDARKVEAEGKEYDGSEHIRLEFVPAEEEG